MFETRKIGNKTVLTINMENANMIGLDYIKRALGQKGRGLPKKRSEEAAGYFEVYDQLRDELVNINPKYGEALRIWSDKSSAERALDWGKIVMKEVNSGKKSIDTVIDEFAVFSDSERSLARLGVGEHMKIELNRRANTKTGMTPASVFTIFAGSPAHRQFLRSIFETTDDFRRFEKLIQREGVLGDTVKAVNVDDVRDVALQQAFALGDLPEIITGMGTDALFARSGNRFAVLRLIQQAFTQHLLYF